MPESIVSYAGLSQQEWLPRITDLVNLLPDARLLWSYRADKRMFLSPGDRIFTNLFTYGMISIYNKNVYVPSASLVRQPDKTQVKNPKDILSDYLASTNIYMLPPTPTRRA